MVDDEWAATGHGGRNCEWSQDMSKALQEQRERSVGDQFASWLSGMTGHECTFKRRGTPKHEPDLLYEFRHQELGVEVTSAYYGDDHAAFLWKGLRAEADAPTTWSGVNPNVALADAVLKSVAQKSVKPYAENALLLIDIPPGVTSAEELEGLLAVRSLPHSPFSGIYLVGRFPLTTTSAGGYRVLALKPMI